MGCSESKALPVDEPSTKPPEKTSEAQKEQKNVEPEVVNDKIEELNDSLVESEDKPETEKSEDDQKEVKSSVIFLIEICPENILNDPLRRNLSLGILNPYWQIMENSSRNFSEVFNFRVITQAVLLENSSIRIFRLKPYMICNIWSGGVFQ